MQDEEVRGATITNICVMEDKALFVAICKIYNIKIKIYI